MVRVCSKSLFYVHTKIQNGVSFSQRLFECDDWLQTIQSDHSYIEININSKKLKLEGIVKRKSFFIESSAETEEFIVYTNSIEMHGFCFFLFRELLV